MYCSKCGMQMPEMAGTCIKCGAIIEKESSKEFYSYDYLTVDANVRNAAEYIDCYECLGWKVTNTRENFALNQVSLNFRRDRKIKNKEHLQRCQARLDDAIKGINVLERKKTNQARVVSLSVGVAGTLTLGGGMCLCLLNTALGVIIAGSVVGVIGIAVAAMAYPLFKRIAKKKTQEIAPIISKKRDEIAEICEEAKKYL